MITITENIESLTGNKFIKTRTVLLFGMKLYSTQKCWIVSDKKTDAKR